MSEDVVLVERSDAVAVVTLNRPKVHNALNAEVLRTLRQVVTELGTDPAVNAIVLTGSGEKSFCAGADLDELAGLDTVAATEVLRAGQEVMSTVARSRVPVIAAVNGLALGGGFELVLSSTFAILSERASLALPESGLGLIPGYGGTQRLPLLVGRSAAAHLMLTSERLGAQRAYELGLSLVPPVPAEELRDVALRTAEDIAGRGPWAVSRILEALRTAAPAQEALDFETALAGAATGSAEAAEGVAAFKERRAPKFEPRTGF